tara:strand:+ start:480 stop:656 length:177 start_codon:yes stop_codon:yes gene_type:complete
MEDAQFFPAWVYQFTQLIQFLFSTFLNYCKNIFWFVYLDVFKLYFAKGWYIHKEHGNR